MIETGAATATATAMTIKISFNISAFRAKTANFAAFGVLGIFASGENPQFVLCRNIQTI
jgi:hypothetical protein